MAGFSDVLTIGGAPGTAQFGFAIPSISVSGGPFGEAAVGTEFEIGGSSYVYEESLSAGVITTERGPGLTVGFSVADYQAVAAFELPVTPGEELGFSANEMALATGGDDLDSAEYLAFDPLIAFIVMPPGTTYTAESGTVYPVGPVVPVPEPSSLLLFGSAIAGAAVWRRRMLIRA